MQEEIDRLLSDLKQYFAIPGNEEPDPGERPEDAAAERSVAAGEEGAGRASWWRHQFHG